MPSNPCTVDDVVAGWIRHFYPADRTLRVVSAETLCSWTLAPGVVVGGRVDAIGDDWFGEWKSMNPRNRSGWREKWRFHPQTLTYGLLLRKLRGDISRFTIRVAFKSDPPTFDHEWFSYSDVELDTWEGELQRIACELVSYRHTQEPHWALNPLNCLKYGSNYACSFLHRCTHALWDVPVAGLVKREPGPIESQTGPGCIVLDPTRVECYLGCPEQFRRIYQRNEVEPPSEALRFGGDFHELLGVYYAKVASGEIFDEKGVNVTWPNL